MAAQHLGAAGASVPSGGSGRSSWCLAKHAPSLTTGRGYGGGSTATGSGRVFGADRPAAPQSLANAVALAQGSSATGQGARPCLSVISELLYIEARSFGSLWAVSHRSGCTTILFHHSAIHECLYTEAHSFGSLFATSKRSPTD